MFVVRQSERDPTEMWGLWEDEVSACVKKARKST